MEKLLLHLAAAMLTNAACGNTSNNPGSGNAMPLSPDLSNPDVRNKNLQVWETHRVFYNALLGTLPAQGGWAAPDKSSSLASALQGLQGLLGRVPPILSSVSGLIPNPGTPAAPPASAAGK